MNSGAFIHLKTAHMNVGGAAVSAMRKVARGTMPAILMVVLFCAGWFCCAGQEPGSVTMIESLIRSGRYEDALEATRSALKEKSSDYRLWTLEGIILSMQGKGQDAQQAFSRALRISPQYMPALKGKVEILYQHGDEGAIPLLEQILKAAPNDRTAHEMLGGLERKKDRCEQAAEHFALSGDAVDKHTESLEAYGDCLVKLKRLQDAVPVFEKLVTLLPDRSYPRYDLAVVLVANKQNAEALKALEPLLTPDQAEADILSLASQAAEAIKETPRAVALLRQAIVQSPSTPDYYVAFAMLCLDHESFDVGIEMINAGLSRIPNTASLYVARGLLYAQLTEYDKAENDFARAGQLDVNQSLSAYAADLAQLQKNDPDEALRRVRVQLKAHPESSRLHYLLAEVLMNSEPEADSEAFKEALNEVVRALKLQPDLVSAKNLLASMYMRAGQYDKAVEQCRTALEYAPNDETAVYRLMISLKHLGRKDELPQLVKRLAELHQQSLKNETDRKRYRFVVGAGSAGEPAQK
jgi:tetratricopeptide (TPR) repeat protein